MILFSKKRKKIEVGAEVQVEEAEVKKIMVEKSYINENIK
jgi:hypothetical protein